MMVSDDLVTYIDSKHLIQLSIFMPSVVEAMHYSLATGSWMYASCEAEALILSVQYI